MDALKDLLEGFDLAALLPQLDTMLGKVELLTRIAVMVGPVVLLGMGLFYFLAAPKEANHSLGYRFYWGMSSVEAWQFTQRLAGAVWAVLGLVLTVVMALLCARFRGMEAMDMVWFALRLVLWELGLVAVSCLAIDITVLVFFDRKGSRPAVKRSSRQSLNILYLKERKP